MQITRLKYLLAACLLSGSFLFAEQASDRNKTDFGIMPLRLISLRKYSEKALKREGLNRYIADFPFDEYKVYKISRVGKFYVDEIPDGIKQHIKQGVHWEYGIAEYIRKYARRGSIVLDIGAHIGIHTFTMSKCVGPSGIVVAFEPQRKIFRELWHNVKRNKDTKNIVLLPIACGEEEKDIEMNPRNITNEGGTHVGKGGDHAHMVPIDSLKLNNVSFIKLDVESYELYVLRGAIETIKRNQPVIVFEVLGEVDLDNLEGENKVYVEEVMSLLQTLGYKIEKIQGNDYVAFPILKNSP